MFPRAVLYPQRSLIGVHRGYCPQYHLHVRFRFVLDTNVLVAAMRSNREASRQLLLAALDQGFDRLLSVPLMIECEAVLNRAGDLTPSGVTESDIRDILDELTRVCIPVRLAYLWWPRLRDANDDMVLETAANGNADAIVTFNLADFRGIKSLLRCNVIAPREALVQLTGGRK